MPPSGSTSKLYLQTHLLSISAIQPIHCHSPPLHSLLQSIFHTTPRVVFWKHIGYITPYFKTFQLLPILLIISTCLPMAYRALHDLTSSCTHALLTILKLYHLHLTPQKHQMYSHLRASVPDVPSASNIFWPGSSPWLVSHHSGLSSNVTSLGRPFLTTSFPLWFIIHTPCVISFICSSFSEIALLI